MEQGRKPRFFLGSRRKTQWRIQSSKNRHESQRKKKKYRNRTPRGRKRRTHLFPKSTTSREHWARSYKESHCPIRKKRQGKSEKSALLQGFQKTASFLGYPTLGNPVGQGEKKNLRDVKSRSSPGRKKKGVGTADTWRRTQGEEGQINEEGEKSWGETDSRCNSSREEKSGGGAPDKVSKSRDAVPGSLRVGEGTQGGWGTPRWTCSKKGEKKSEEWALISRRGKRATVLSNVKRAQGKRHKGHPKTRPLNPDRKTKGQILYEHVSKGKGGLVGSNKNEKGKGKMYKKNKTAGRLFSEQENMDHVVGVLAGIQESIKKMPTGFSSQKKGLDGGPKKKRKGHGEEQTASEPKPRRKKFKPKKKGNEVCSTAETEKWNHCNVGNTTQKVRNRCRKKSNRFATIRNPEKSRRRRRKKATNQTRNWKGGLQGAMRAAKEKERKGTTPRKGGSQRIKKRGVEIPEKRPIISSPPQTPKP